MILLTDYRQHRLTLQKNENTCGIASIRNSFFLSFNCDIPERELWGPAQKIYDDRGMKRKILRDGIGPMAMAELIKNIGREKLKKELKVFMTPRGNIQQLEHFLAGGISPIIHRSFLEGDCGGHYETVIGIDNNYIYMFNPANDSETSGIHKKTLEEFDEKWWPFDNEQWFLAYYLADVILSRKKFKGKYG
jgi:hypothetical protein